MPKTKDQAEFERGLSKGWNGDKPPTAASPLYKPTKAEVDHKIRLLPPHQEDIAKPYKRPGVYIDDNAIPFIRPEALDEAEQPAYVKEAMKKYIMGIDFGELESRMMATLCGLDTAGALWVLDQCEIPNKNGDIFPKFKPKGTVTGRFRHSEPAWQDIPIVPAKVMHVHDSVMLELPKGTPDLEVEKFMEHWKEEIYAAMGIPKEFLEPATGFSKMGRAMADGFAASAAAAMAQIKEGRMNPKCPHCDGPMQKMVASKGINKDKEFYGCVAVTDCCGTRTMGEARGEFPALGELHHQASGKYLMLWATRADGGREFGRSILTSRLERNPNVLASEFIDPCARAFNVPEHKIYKLVYNELDVPQHLWSQPPAIALPNAEALQDWADFEKEEPTMKRQPRKRTVQPDCYDRASYYDSANEECKECRHKQECRHKLWCQRAVIGADKVNKNAGKDPEIEQDKFRITLLKSMPKKAIMLTAKFKVKDSLCKVLDFAAFQTEGEVKRRVRRFANEVARACDGSSYQVLEKIKKQAQIRSFKEASKLQDICDVLIEENRRLRGQAKSPTFANGSVGSDINRRAALAEDHIEEKRLTKAAGVSNEVGECKCGSRNGCMCQPVGLKPEAPEPECTHELLVKIPWAVACELDPSLKKLGIEEDPVYACKECHVLRLITTVDEAYGDEEDDDE